MSTNETKVFRSSHPGYRLSQPYPGSDAERGDSLFERHHRGLRGSVDNVQYTHFECTVSGKKAQEIVRQLTPAVEGNSKVLIGFTLSDLNAESFTFKNGDKAGETGISLKSRLLRIAWAKVDGQPFYTAQENAA